MRKLIVSVFLVALSGCTAVQVVPLEKSHNVGHVCIEENERVMVGGFIETVADLFHDHGITTELYNKGARPANCEYSLTYTALRSWDFAPYLSQAELRMFKGYQRIAFAEYRLRGNGGLSLVKWAGVRSKMGPVVNELLAQYRLH